MTKAYKVVCVYEDGSLGSCTIRRGPLGIDYVPHKWTAKRKYGPMVFVNKDRALQFMLANFPYSLRLGYYQVWECDAEGVHQCDRVLPVDDVLASSVETVRKHMDAIGVSLQAYANQWAPSGTNMASRVRLTKRVE